MIFTPDIFDFHSEQTFKKLQNKFMDYDERYPHYNESNEIRGIDPHFTKASSDDFEIIYKEINQHGEETYEAVSFYKDFLKNAIPTLSNNRILKIKKELNTTFKYKIPESKLFIQTFLNDLQNLKNSVFSSAYLNDEYKIPIMDEIDKILDFVHGLELWKDEKEDSKKIKLKLSRAEIVGLFFLLKQRGLTESKYDNELGRLIEDNFMCYDKTTKSYKKITTPHKLLSGFKNGDKAISTAAQNLKEIFSDSKFYELKP